MYEPLKEESIYKDGKWDGITKLYDKYGKTLEITYKNGKFHGNEKMY